MPRSESVTREHLLDVAGPLFYDRGVGATGVAEIVAATRCGKQALYRHFPTKDDLVAAYLTRVVADREQRTADALRAAGDDPVERVVAVVDEVARRAGRSWFHGCAMRNFLREQPHTDGHPTATRVAEQYVKRSRRQLDRLCAAARPGERRIADQVWLVHEGLYAGHATTAAARAAGVDLVRTLVSDR